jgi:hypothetical protein
MATTIQSAPTMQEAVDRAAINYHRAKREFEHFDALSRQRALTHQESRLLERAIQRMSDWGTVE